MKMTAEEALTAATLNAAAALCLSSQVGSLEIGKQQICSLQMFPHIPTCFYHFGINHIQSVFVNGKKVV
jgi:imidazolonepropionase